MSHPLRGEVYRADLGYGLKPWLVVSNNHRNRAFADILVVRITTTARDLPTWVPLGRDDPLGGYVSTDNIEVAGKDELGQRLGALSPGTIVKVNEALAIALGLS
ncbi:endoribonuclease MazF1 [Longimycelium tulufanense]|uniref:Endoribonuclease MazF1 n=1 Tax=Longimycelium tulufanense TaxID=907463 RepID=A0A8J3FUF5_9PSEU|nr:type II toxin-antitoxin system PemK/MazF family toxin [Longimycelium tulufanense]GGM34632.1 endoribonuclease MazF1 [Longimycelium tulufanense]